MRIRKCKGISLLLVIILLLSAVFVNDGRAESSSVIVPTDGTDCPVILLGATLTDAQLCTTEMLGIRNNAGNCQLTARFMNRKGEESISVSALFFCGVTFNQELLLSKSDATRMYNQFLEELIALYIHKTDGKKRI